MYFTVSRIFKWPHCLEHEYAPNCRKFQVVLSTSSKQNQLEEIGAKIFYILYILRTHKPNEY